MPNTSAGREVSMRHRLLELEHALLARPVTEEMRREAARRRAGSRARRRRRGRARSPE